jgi:hypothetical protein
MNQLASSLPEGKVQIYAITNHILRPARICQPALVIFLNEPSISRQYIWKSLLNNHRLLLY